MNSNYNKSRRRFLKSAGAAAIGGTLAFNTMANTVNNSDTLKVGLIGCGGRGTGAANQALKADKNAVLTAMADVFEDRLDTSFQNLVKLHPNQVNVDKSSKYLGFDAYQKLINSDVDVVILATPPAFRPDHLLMAANAGKHIFCEKPMAVDPKGVKKVLEVAKIAKQKERSLVSGFCWRYDYPKRATFQKVLNGSIGNIKTIYNTYNTGELWSRPRQDNWSNMEYQLRNWLYYNWLSGDHIAEQAVHSIDMMSWAMGDKLPVRAVGTGGRQSRTEDIYGNIFDHFAIVYEYPDDVKGFHFSRQQKGCANSYSCEMYGTEGTAIVDVIRRKHEINGKENWRYKGEENNMYQTEHDELFASIRSGNLMNDGVWMAHSTMLAILGRIVAYTGQSITWEEALNADYDLGPAIDEYSWDLKWKSNPVAKPGITKIEL